VAPSSFVPSLVWPSRPRRSGTAPDDLNVQLVT
jgi:hypothetical protein